MRMRNVPKFRKIPKGLARGEPLRHQDHPRPTTRRQFISQGFMAGGASVLLPSLAALLANPRIAHAQLAPDLKTAVTACGITQGAGMIPFICFDLSGGANIAGSNVLVGGPTGQLDFLSVAGYSKLGLPGTMVPNSSTTSFIDSSLSLRYHSDSAQLRGIKTKFTNTAAMAKVTGTIVPALSQNDTNTNPHNPMYGIWQAGAQGALLNLIGTDSSVSGGNSMAPPNMINVAAQPTTIDSGPRHGGPGEHGTAEHLAAQFERRDQRARIDEAHQRREVPGHPDLRKFAGDHECTDRPGLRIHQGGVPAQSVPEPRRGRSGRRTIDRRLERLRLDFQSRGVSRQFATSRRPPR